MAAAALARDGHHVAVFEKLSFIGGRYTEIDHAGYRVTTAAWTSLGPKSHIGEFLAEMGADIEYVSLRDKQYDQQFTIRFKDGREFDSGRSAQNMMLAAWAEGVTSCPVTMHDAACARRVLGLPETHRVSIVLAFGYPVPGERRPVSPRLPLDELVHRERWQPPGGS